MGDAILQLMATSATGPVGPDQFLRDIATALSTLWAAPDLMSGQQAGRQPQPSLYCWPLEQVGSVWFRMTLRYLRLRILSVSCF